MTKVIQSVLFSRGYSLEEATKILQKSDLRADKVHVTRNFLRFRQTRPKAGARYSTIEYKNNGRRISIVTMET